MKKTYSIADFQTMASSINPDIREKNMFEKLRNINLDTDGMAKKRTGFANFLPNLTDEEKDNIDGDKKGLIFYDGKIWSGKLQVNPNQNDVLVKHDVKYIPPTAGNANFIAYTPSVDFDENIVFSGDKNDYIRTNHISSIDYYWDGNLIGSLNKTTTYEDYYIKIKIKYKMSSDSSGEWRYTEVEDLFGLKQSVILRQDFHLGTDYPYDISFEILELKNKKTNKEIDKNLVKVSFDILFPGNQKLYTCVATPIKRTEVSNKLDGEYNYIQIKLDKTIRIWKYSITKVSGLFARNFSLLGSDDGINFTVLDNRGWISSNEPNGTDIEYELDLNNFPNGIPPSFLYYRFQFKKEITEPSHSILGQLNIFRATVSSNVVETADLLESNEPNFKSDNINVVLVANGQDISIVKDSSNFMKTGETIYSGVKTDLNSIEAVQFKNSIIIPTGNKLIRVRFMRNELDTNKKIITIVDELDKYPKIPTIVEDSVLGGNIFNGKFPFDAENNFSAGGNRIDFVRALPFTGSLGSEIQFVPYFSTKLIDTTDLELKWYIKKNTDDNWVLVDTISGTLITKFIATKHFNSLGTYNIKVEMYSTNDPTILDEKIFSYVVDNKKYDEIKWDETNKTYVSNIDAVDQINSCTKALVHYNKLVLYGNGSENIYVGVPGEDAYFINQGILTLDSNYAGNVINITPYKDMLMVFTDKSISAITGKGDFINTGDGNFEPYELYGLETNIGIVSSEGAIGIDNFTILATNNGLFSIGAVSVSERRIELTQIDKFIENISLKGIKSDLLINVALGYWDNKLFISIPKFDNDDQGIKGRIYVLDIESGGRWSYYDSSETGITKFVKYKGKLYAINTSKNILVKNDELVEIDYSTKDYDINTFKDNESDYVAEIETSFIDLGTINKTKSIEEIRVEYSNVFGFETNINLALNIDGVNVIEPNSEESNQKNLEAFEFGKSFFGEGQFGNKHRNIHVVNAQNFKNNCSNEGVRFKVNLFVNQPYPFYVSKIEVDYITLNTFGETLKGG